MQTVDFFRRIALGSAVGTILLGLVVLLAWHTGVDLLIQILPGFAAMQYNTALCFVLIGTALLASLMDWSRVGVAFSAVCGVIGGLTLFQYFSGLNLHIDELLMENYIELPMLYPGRMSPNTALSFFLAAMAIFANLKRLGITSIGAITGLIVAGMGLTSLIGYLFHLSTTYGWGNLPQMAIHTAAGFLLLGIGLACLAWKTDLQTADKPEYGKHLLVAMIAIVFLFVDLNMPRGVAAGITYVMLPLLGWIFSNRKMPLHLGVLASILIFIGFFFSPIGAEPWIGALNRGYALVALWGIAILLYLLKGQRKTLEVINGQLHQQNDKLEQASQSLQTANNDLNSASQELEKFVYLVSHDLRAPIRHVEGFAEVLLDPKEKLEPTERTRFLQNIRFAARRLDKMILGLLSYAGNRNQELSYQLISVSGLLEELKQQFSREHTSPPIQWEIGDLPDCTGDENLLRQVWENLLSNAIKYSANKAEIHLKVWGERKETETLYVVQDQGAGFDMRFANKLFAIFQRLHDSTEFQGTGVGLANVQRILELHGGRIWAEGVVDQGATFSFTLPNELIES